MCDKLADFERNGSVVIGTVEGPVEYRVKDFVSQPIEGIWYDLGLTGAELVSIPRPSTEIGRLYACSVVIAELKNQLDEMKKKGGG